MLPIEGLLGVIFALLGIGLVYLTFQPEEKIREDIIESEEKKNVIDYFFLLTPQGIFEWVFGWVFDTFPYWVVKIFFFLLATICFAVSFTFFT